MAIAIGDIHGCLDTLKALISRLPPGEDLVFLGDYVDRGPDSAGVIDYLTELSERRPCRLLMGNHEHLMRQVTETLENLTLWRANGGDETLRSYRQEPEDWLRLHDRAAPLRRFLTLYPRLMLWHEDEHAIYVHAGVDVQVPDMAAQKPEVLMWIRERFYQRWRDWQGKPVVFGHTPTHVMGLPRGRIFQQGKLYGIDTGCVYGGVLTALDTRTGRLYQQESEMPPRR